jgi:hypothetical protein
MKFYRVLVPNLLMIYALDRRRRIEDNLGRTGIIHKMAHLFDFKDMGRLT